jgi:hypothetical protein
LIMQTRREPEKYGITEKKMENVEENKWEKVSYWKWEKQ